MSSPAPIVCIGEMLWDVLPASRQPGGAPFNAALYLHRLGQPVQLISRVGDDELGRELLAFSARQGLATQLIQQSDSHLTGVVKATVEPGQDVAYCILEPVAWDYLQYTPAVRAAVSEARMLVYGSLAARSATSRETLYRLLPQAAFKVFDVNLRPPHYSREIVKYLLRQADLVKLNRAELAEIMTWLGQPVEQDTALPWLARRFGLQTICVTHADGGATLWTANEFFHYSGSANAVPAAIGSSDAFLAGLLTGLLAGHTPARCLYEACATAADVSSRAAGRPAVQLADSLPAP